jgi:hypothetical protein
MLSSIIIYSIPDELSVPERKITFSKLKIELINSNSRQLMRALLGFEEEEEQMKDKHQKSLENLFICQETNFSLERSSKFTPENLLKKEMSFQRSTREARQSLLFGT